jgi:LysM repeat protein
MARHQRARRTRRGPGRILAGFGAAVALLALVIGLPWVLAIVAGNPFGGLPAGQDLWTALTSPDDGRLFLRTLGLVGWLAWATFALSVIVEIPAQLRGRRTVRLPGLGLQQRLAAGLVAAIAAVIITPPMAAPLALAGPPSMPAITQAAYVQSTVPTTVTPTTAAPAPDSSGHLRHTVERGESLLGLAERYGVPLPELAAANYGVTQPDGRSLQPGQARVYPGWVLRIPVSAPTSPTTAPAITAPSGPTTAPAIPAQAGPTTPAAGGTGAGLGTAAGAPASGTTAGGSLTIEVAPPAGRPPAQAQAPIRAAPPPAVSADTASAARAAPAAAERAAVERTPAESAPAERAAAGQEATELVYEVRRGDWLGGIAERFLGDFGRYPEIAALNPQLEARDHRFPDHIEASWRITLPPDAADHGSQRHATGSVVSPAGGATGEGSSRAPGNAGQPGDAGAPSGDAQAGGPGARGDAETPGARGDAAPPPAAAPAGDRPPRADGISGLGADPPADAGNRVGAAPLAAAGLLATLILGTVIGLRRRQQQHRRPYRRLPEPRGGMTERDLRVAQQPADVGRLEEALRHLAGELAGRSGAELPDIVGAWLDGGTVQLLLSARCIPPVPWLDQGHRWVLPPEVPLPDTDGQVPPLPTLVTVGSQPERHLLLDLERLGTICIGGDTERTFDLLRYIASELACNSWSDDVEVIVAGLPPDQGELLASLNPDRVHVIASVAAAVEQLRRRIHQATGTLDRLGAADTFAARVGDLASDAWMPQVLLVAAPGETDIIALAGLSHDLSAAGRCAVAVATTAHADTPLSPNALTVTADGVLHVTTPSLRTSAAAAGLSVPELARLAEIMQTSRRTDDAPVPPAPEIESWAMDSDAAGSIWPGYESYDSYDSYGEPGGGYDGAALEGVAFEEGTGNGAAAAAGGYHGTNGLAEGPGGDWRTGGFPPDVSPGEAPVSGFPVSGFPVSGSPVSGSPVSGSPVSGAGPWSTPPHGAPPPVTPDPAAPLSPAPGASAPLSPAPISPWPISPGPMPAESMPAQAMPAGPVSGAPVSGGPVSGVPVSGVPVSGVPVSGVPVSGVPVSPGAWAEPPMPGRPGPTEPQTAPEPVRRAAAVVPALAAPRRRQITVAIRARRDQLDPDLDDDLDAWMQADLSRPRISILGPVEIASPGEVPAQRQRFYEEMVLFLTQRGARGADRDQLEDALAPHRALADEPLRVIISRARRWLGENPAGEPWLMDLGADNRYRLADGCLFDWHLFRRLRTRGEANGRDGVPDLRAALELVRGAPLEGTDRAWRSGGRTRYAWLPESDINPPHLVSAIVDTAHELAELYLDAGEPDRARWAVHHGWLADPYRGDDELWRDLMRAEHGDGRLDELRQLVTELMSARGVEVPEDLHPQTYQFLVSLLPDQPRPATQGAARDEGVVWPA